MLRAGAPARRQLIAWRRRALEQQLLRVSFPGGAGAPSLVYLCALVALALAATLVFAIHSRPGVPQAILDSQRDLVSRIALSLGSAYGSSADRVARAVENYAGSEPAEADQLLAGIVDPGQPWSGAVVIDEGTRRPLAARGASVPVDAVPETVPERRTLPILTDDGPALILAVPLREGQRLLAYQPVLMRNLRLNPEARQGVFILTPDGRFYLMQGANPVAAESARAVLGDLATVRSSIARSLPIQGTTERRLVASAAPIGATGLVVASVIVAEVAAGVPMVQGLVLGLSLFVVAILSFVLMRRSLVVPLHNLLRKAKADACGETSGGRPRLHIREAYRIARALAVSSNAPPDRAGARPSALSGLAVATSIALAWSAIVAAAAIRSEHPPMPAQLLVDEESRAEAASAALGQALADGLAVVSRIVAAHPDPQRAAMADLLERELENTRRFRALYLADPTGAPVASAGRRPLRQTRPLPGESGVRLDATEGRLPVIYAYRLAANGHAIVGEFELDHLRRILRQVHGRARVVDAELRTILDSKGYLAFEELRGEGVRAAAVATLPGGTVGRADPSRGASTLIASSAMQSPPAVAHLEWSVVIARNVAALGLPGVIAQRWSLLMACAVAAIALLILAWHYFVFVRPLRRLTEAADVISGGDFTTPVTPQRHDEIGAIAVCLEICRQVRHTGSARFGGAVRLRGSEDDFTAVLPRVPAPADAGTARDASGRGAPRPTIKQPRGA
jgi:HAMP domain-containing protein